MIHEARGPKWIEFAKFIKAERIEIDAEVASTAAQATDAAHHMNGSPLVPSNRSTNEEALQPAQCGANGASKGGAITPPNPNATSATAAAHGGTTTPPSASKQPLPPPSAPTPASDASKKPTVVDGRASQPKRTSFGREKHVHPARADMCASSCLSLFRVSLQRSSAALLTAATWPRWVRVRVARRWARRRRSSARRSASRSTGCCTRRSTTRRRRRHHDTGQPVLSAS